MANNSENTPFLTDNDHDDGVNSLNGSEDEAVEVKAPANAHFKRPIKILTIVLAVLSALTVAVLIASFVMIQVAPFKGYTYSARKVIQELGTCTFISLILSILMIFLTLPILISLLISLILPILILVYAGNIFGNGWPEKNWCYDYYSQPRMLDPECLRFIGVSRILMGIGAGLGFVVGLLFLVILLLRIIAVSRTKFWKRSAGQLAIPTGQYTFSVTLGVMKKGAPESGRKPSRGRSEEGHLIET